MLSGKLNLRMIWLEIDFPQMPALWTLTLKFLLLFSDTET